MFDEASAQARYETGVNDLDHVWNGEGVVEPGLDGYSVTDHYGDSEISCDGAPRVSNVRRNRRSDGEKMIGDSRERVPILLVAERCIEGVTLDRERSSLRVTVPWFGGHLDTGPCHGDCALDATDRLGIGDPADSDRMKCQWMDVAVNKKQSENEALDDLGEGDHQLSERCDPEKRHWEDDEVSVETPCKCDVCEPGMRVYGGDEKDACVADVFTEVDMCGSCEDSVNSFRDLDNNESNDQGLGDTDAGHLVGRV